MLGAFQDMGRTVFILIIVAVLLNSCVSTTVEVYQDIKMNQSDLFYIATYNDNLGLNDSIRECFNDFGLEAKTVYNAISIPEASTPVTAGSGFYIAPDIIVTNNHVLNGEDKAVYYQNGIEHSAFPIFANEQNDVAILKGDFTEDPYFKLLSSSDYSIASSVFVLGYPLTDILGDEIRVTNGIVSAKSGLSSDSNSIQISAPIQPGNSGGPVVDEKYEVIGVVSSKLSDAYSIASTNSIAQNVNFAIKSDLVSFFASKYLPIENNANYVDTLEEAINATVKVVAGGTEIIPSKQYYIDFSYKAGWDLIPVTLVQMSILCIDVETSAVVAEAHFSGSVFKSPATIAKELTHELIVKLYDLSKSRE